MNDEEFRRWPDNIVAQLMSERGCYVSRQTIGNYRENLVDGIAFLPSCSRGIAMYPRKFQGFSIFFSSIKKCDIFYLQGGSSSIITVIEWKYDDLLKHLTVIIRVFINTYNSHI